jgi:hypothetical protein
MITEDHGHISKYAMVHGYTSICICMASARREYRS